MGLYSRNEVAGVSVNESAEIMQEIEECGYDSNFGDILEATIQLHENDQRMFDTLIGCDFMSAMNEAVMLEEEAAKVNDAANEKKSLNIKEKIVQIWEAFIGAIKKAVANIIYKITDLVKADKKLYELYKPVLTMDNLKDFPGIADFAFPKAIVDKDSLKSVKAAEKFTADFTSAVTSAESKDVIDSAYEAFMKKVSDEEESFKNLTSGESYFGEKEKLWKPSENWEITKMLNVLNSASDTIKDIKTHAAEVIGALKTLKSKAKSATGSKKALGEVEAYKMNKLYIVSSKTCKLFSHEFKAYTGLAMRQIAACRKAAILCGRYALKQSKGTSKSGEKIERVEGEIVTDEATMMWIIGESSDAYVAECLGY